MIEKEFQTLLGARVAATEILRNKLPAEDIVSLSTALGTMIRSSLQAAQANMDLTEDEVMALLVLSIVEIVEFYDA